MTSLESRKATLAVIEGAVCKDRTATHGPPENNFADIAAFWSIWISKRFKVDIQLDALDVAEMCNLLKSARKISNIAVLDHWDDGAGYNVCGGGILRQRQAAAEGEKPTEPKLDSSPLANRHPTPEELRKIDPCLPKTSSPGFPPDVLKKIVVPDAFRNRAVPTEPFPYPTAVSAEFLTKE